jgi:multiple sugar transport system ATP-binding protein
VSSIALEHITKRYPDGFEAVKDMSLEIADGEFMVLVGPSGSGKSTALRMVAGLEDITDGVLRIGGQVVNQRAPKDRDVAMVFQSYALYPHMTVRENMSFALKLAKVPRAQIDAKVNEAASALGLEEHLDRKPAHLSGGQRQRVAMGRAIVRDPKAFLMDEPLSNLDAKLRLQTRTEISRIQRRLGTTTIYVTHDQVEALTLADRLAVMRDGRLQQVGAPNYVYEHPDNIFVAGFIGSPAMNFLSGRLGDGLLRTAIGDITVPDALRRRVGSVLRGDGEVIVGIRPEHLEDAALVGDPSRGHTFKVNVDVLESLGSERYVHFTVNGERAPVDPQQLGQETAATGFGRSRQGVPLIALVGADSRARQDQEAQLWVDTSQLHLFDPESGRNLVAGEREPTVLRAAG